MRASTTVQLRRLGRGTPSRSDLLPNREGDRAHMGAECHHVSALQASHRVAQSRPLEYDTRDPERPNDAHLADVIRHILVRIEACAPTVAESHLPYRHAPLTMPAPSFAPP